MEIFAIYLNNIVIWSETVEEHEQNVKAMLDALHKARLYVKTNKTNLFCTEIDFLGHHISSWGIEADNKKVDHISPYLKTLLKSEVLWA